MDVFLDKLHSDHGWWRGHYSTVTLLMGRFVAWTRLINNVLENGPNKFFTGIGQKLDLTCVVEVLQHE